MIPLVVLFLIFTFLFFIRLLFNTYGYGRPSRNLPPGPRRFPIIGNLHMLGQLPHRSLEKLAQKYGPIMSLQLGSVLSIIVSSPEAAELFLKQNDAIFASRPTNEIAEKLFNGAVGIAFSPYGNYWRHMKKISTLQLLTTSKVEGLEGLRTRETEATVLQLKRVAMLSEVVDLGETVEDLIQEIIFKMVVGKGKNEEKRFDLKSIIEDTMDLAGAINFADFIPFLAHFDLQGLKKRMKNASNVIEETLECIIDDHLIKEDFGQQKDIVDTLLAIMNNPDSNNEFKWFGRSNIKALIFEIFAAGMDTSSVTITWALAALFKHPRVVSILRDELDTIVGRGRMVNGSDLPKLSYLDMVVKETFRLYTVAPLLIPHESLEDVVINGYSIPKKSRIIVNNWAIGRDPSTWSRNAQEFYPERFLSKDVDFRGRDFDLLPFGAGRRGCPGIQLGLVMVKFILAQLVHCFDWKLPDDMQPHEIDMDEKFGLTMRRAKKLYAIPAYRLEV